MLMKHKITAIISATTAVLLLIFSIGFDFAKPRPSYSGESSDDFTDYYNFNYENYSTKPDWIDVYSRTYIKFIDEANTPDHVDVIMLDLTELEHLSGSDRKKVLMNVAQKFDKDVLNGDYFNLYYGNFLSENCLHIQLNSSTYTKSGLYITGKAWFDGNELGYHEAYWKLNYEERWQLDDEYTSYNTSPSWVEIYAQTYVSFLIADSDLLSSFDVVVIDTSALKFIANSVDREAIVRHIEQSGFAVIDAAFEELDETDFFLMENRNANSPEYLRLDLYPITYDYDRIGISGYSFKYFDSENSGINFFNTSWKLTNRKWQQTPVSFEFRPSFE